MYLPYLIHDLNTQQNGLAPMGTCHESQTRKREESNIQSASIKTVTVPVLLQWTDQGPSVEPSLQPEQSLQESSHG